MIELLSKVLLIMTDVSVVATVICVYGRVHNTRFVYAFTDLVSHIVLVHVIMAIADRVATTLMSIM